MSDQNDTPSPLERMIEKLQLSNRLITMSNEDLNTANAALKNILDEVWGLVDDEEPVFFSEELKKRIGEAID